METEKNDEVSTRYMEGDKLDIFTIETNVRKMIRDLLEPVVNKAHDDRKDVQIIKTKIDTYEDKIEFLESCVFSRSPNVSSSSKSNHVNFQNDNSENNSGRGK